MYSRERKEQNINEAILWHGEARLDWPLVALEMTVRGSLCPWNEYAGGELYSPYNCPAFARHHLIRNFF